MGENAKMGTIVKSDKLARYAHDGELVAVDVTDFLADVLNQTKADGTPKFSANTQRAYGKAIEDFALWAISQGIEPKQITANTFDKHLSYLRTVQGVSESSIRIRVPALKKLVSWWRRERILDKDTHDDIIDGFKGDAKVKSQRQKTWLSANAVREAIDDIDTNKIKGIRDRAMAALMVGCGLRRNEVAEMQLDHIRPISGYTQNKKYIERWKVDVYGKGSKWRPVAIPQWALPPLTEWLDCLDMTLDKTVAIEKPLFRKIQKGGLILDDGIAGDTVRRAVSAVFGDEIAPHDLRRTFAQLMADGYKANGEQIDIQQIQLNLGHESIRTTEIYLDAQTDMLDSAVDRIQL